MNDISDDMDCGSMESVDPLSADVLRAFKRMMRLNRQLMSRTAAHAGGHPAQAGCLWVLSRYSDITQRELAEKLHLAPATVTTMLQRMERDGLIERRPDEADQRLTRITLTQAGREQGLKHSAVHKEYVDSVISPLAEDDRRELARLLNLMADNVAKELDR